MSSRGACYEEHPDRQPAVPAPPTHLERITAYFEACGNGTAADIASQFTTDAVIYDTNVRPMVTADGIGADWVRVRDRWQGASWRVDSISGTARQRSRGSLSVSDTCQAARHPARFSPGSR